MLASNEAVAASPFLPEAMSAEAGKTGKPSGLRHVQSVHSMHSMRVDQTSDKQEARAGDASDAVDEEGEHLESLYKSMVKQQEWLGAEILRIKERLRARVESKSVENLTELQFQDDAARGRLPASGPHDGHDACDGLKPQKRYKVFRDDTAIAVGCALGGKGMASRMLSEPEAQSVGPLGERSIEREKSEKIGRSMRKSASQTGLKNQAVDDDQLSLCVPGEHREGDPVSRSREASPPPAVSPRSQRIDSPGSPISPRSREEVTTNDSVDMLRRQSRSRKMSGNGNQSQYNSGKSSYDLLPSSRRPEGDHRDLPPGRGRDIRDQTEYYRPSASESCPDLVRAQGGSVHSLHQHQNPPSEGYPLEYNHRPISPPLNVMMQGHGTMIAPGVHGMPHMQGIPMHAMAYTPQMQSMSMQPYGQMHPLHHMHPMQMQQMQHVQFVPHQLNRPLYGSVQMQQPMVQMQPMQMQPSTVVNPGNLAVVGGNPSNVNGCKARAFSSSGNTTTSNVGLATDAMARPAAATVLRNVLSEASRIQEIKSAGQKVPNSGGGLSTKPTYEPHNGNTISRRDVGDAKVPSNPLAGTPRVAPSLSEMSEPPLGEIHDLNLTPEELDTLFEDLDLPNLG